MSCCCFFCVQSFFLFENLESEKNLLATLSVCHPKDCQQIFSHIVDFQMKKSLNFLKKMKLVRW